MAQDSPRLSDGNKRAPGDGQAPPNDSSQGEPEQSQNQEEPETTKEECERMLPEGATDDATVPTVTAEIALAERTSLAGDNGFPASAGKRQAVGKAATTTPEKKGRHPVAAGRPILGFLRQLFRRDKDEDDKTKDPEAGTELLDTNGCNNKNVETVPEQRPSNGDSEKIKPDEVVAVEEGVSEDEVEPEGKVARLIYRLRSWPRLRVLTVAGSLLLLCLLAVAVACVALRSGHSVDAPLTAGTFVEATTACGPVLGAVEDGALAFRGIPYAAAPVGAARWRPSEPASKLEDCWTGTLQALNRSTLCYQKPLPHPYSQLRFSEDCLHLDVFTPRVTFDEPMPVVVYFAGDSFQGHDSMDFEWRPSARLAREKQVVFVVVYYRMNALGFLSLKLLTRDVHPPTSGNYGLHDMLTSLKWVQRNVEGFGGSTTRVTVLGHGSGATGILALMSSRQAHMLFNQAWITGGSAAFVNKTLEEVERNNEAFNRHLICETPECLYSKTPEQVLSAVPTSEWPFWGVPNHLSLPTVDEHTAAVAVADGVILYDTPVAVWDNEDFMDVTLVVGSALDSVGSQLLDDDFDNFDWAAFNKTVNAALRTFRTTSGGQSLPAEAIDRYYMANSSAVQQYIRMVSDLRVTCPLLNLAYLASKRLSDNVYFYMVAHAPDGRVEHANLSGHRLAVHGLEVAALFGRLPQALGADVGREISERDLRFQATVQDAFYHFVEHGRLATGADRNFRMPWRINWLGETLESVGQYPVCQFWTDAGMYPRYGRMN